MSTEEVFFAVAPITDIKDLSQTSFLQCCFGMILFYNKLCRITKIMKNYQGERAFAVIIKDTFIRMKNKSLEAQT